MYIDVVGVSGLGVPAFEHLKTKRSKSQLLVGCPNLTLCQLGNRVSDDRKRRIPAWLRSGPVAQGYQFNTSPKTMNLISPT